MDPIVRARIVCALTEYDRRASKRRGHNPYALSHYFAALQSADERIADGTALRPALCRSFTDRLLDCVLKAAGLPLATRDEIRFGF